MKYLVLILALLLAGCESFKLGSVCYLPHGQVASCQIQVMPAPAAEPSPGI